MLMIEPTTQTDLEMGNAHLLARFEFSRDITPRMKTTFARNGFILDSKFMEIHNNHSHIVNRGMKDCDELTILVCTLPSEQDGFEHYVNIKNKYPAVNVLWCNEVLPQDIHEDADFWVIWKKVIKKYHPDSLDIMFGYDAYVNIFSKLLNCESKIYNKPYLRNSLTF